MFSVMWLFLRHAAIVADIVFEMCFSKALDSAEQGAFPFYGTRVFSSDRMLWKLLAARFLMFCFNDASLQQSKMKINPIRTK